MLSGPPSTSIQPRQRRPCTCPASIQRGFSYMPDNLCDFAMSVQSGRTLSTNSQCTRFRQYDVDCAHQIPTTTIRGVNLSSKGHCLSSGAIKRSRRTTLSTPWYVVRQAMNEVRWTWRHALYETRGHRHHFLRHRFFMPLQSDVFIAHRVVVPYVLPWCYNCRVACREN